MSSTELLNQTSIKDFIELPKDEQQFFLNRIKINELKEQSEPAVLKKFIAMKVLMEVRIAAEDKSPFNLTAQFRNLLAFITGETGVQFRVQRRVFEDKPLVLNGYRLFHESNTGIWSLARKSFNIGMDDNNNVFTKKSGGTLRSFYLALNEEDETGIINNDQEKWQEWEKLNDSLQLRKLFDEIKKESTYENTFAYDLFCAAIFCGIGLLGAALKTDQIWPVLYVPIALVINVAICAITIPTVFTFFIMEYMLVNPIKWVMEV